MSRAVPTPATGILRTDSIIRRLVKAKDREVEAMTSVRTWLEIVPMVLVGASVVAALGRWLSAAERRGWIRLHGVSKGSAAVAFAAMEDMFSASRSQARQLLEDQKRVGDRAPTPGDGLDDGPSITGRYAGKLIIPVHDAGHCLARQDSSPYAPKRIPSPKSVGGEGSPGTDSRGFLHRRVQSLASSVDAAANARPYAVKNDSSSPCSAPVNRRRANA